MSQFQGTTDGGERGALHDDCFVLYRGSGSVDGFVRAWRRWGEDLQVHVTGEFALALYDHRFQMWILTADALGLTPLYYARTDTGLVFASHLEALSILYPKSHLVDETEFIRAVLDAWPMPWHTLDGDAAPAFSELPEPFFSEPNFMMTQPVDVRHYPKLLAEHDVHTVLSGEGGDSVLSWLMPIPYDAADHALRFRPHRALAAIRERQRREQKSRSLLYGFVRGVAKPAKDYALGGSLATAVPSKPAPSRARSVSRT